MKHPACALLLAGLPACTISNPRLSAVGDTDASPDATSDTDGGSSGGAGSADLPEAPLDLPDSGTSPEIEMLSVDGQGDQAIIDRVRPVALSAVAVDDTVVARAHLRVDGELVGTVEAPPWSVDWRPTDASDNGERMLEVELVGHAGDSDTASVEFRVEVPDPGEIDWERLETVAPFAELAYTAVAVTRDGGIVLAADPGVLRRVAATGDPVWTRTFTGPEARSWVGLAADDSGALAATASFDDQMWVETFDAAGSSAWSSFYEGGSTPGRAEAVAIDGPRLVYVGWHGPPDDQRWMARAHDGAAQVWTLGHGPSYEAVANDVALLSDGGVVVIGREGEGSDDLEAFARTYDPDGTLRWEWLPGRPEGARAVAVDGEDHVVVLLQNLGENSIHRLTPHGGALWSRAWEDLADEPFALVWSLATHPDGDVTAVAGTGEVLHIDALGTRAWSRTLDAELADVAVDELGYAVVVGRSTDGLTRAHRARLHP